MKKAPIQVSARRARHRSAGFTLLELMIAVTVLAIGMSIAVPSFTDIIRRNRLTTQTNNLMSALAIARSEAVKRGTSVTVCPANALTGPGADQCSGVDNWAQNGWIVFSDVRAPLGQVNAVAMDPANTNDSILQRVPPASEQKIQVANEEEITSLTYKQDGTVELPPGTPSTTFTLTPETCRNPDGARELEVIAAGRAGIKKAQCIAR